MLSPKIIVQVCLKTTMSLMKSGRLKAAVLTLHMENKYPS
jgi:hypothetical protein